MIVVVDGYNMLRALIHKGTIDEHERVWLMDLLTYYARKKKNQIVLVFDGGPLSWPEKIAKNRVLTVVYAGQRQSADDYIVEYVDSHREKDIMLVSSDRELCGSVKNLGKSSIGVMHFYNLVKDQIGQVKSAVPKYGPVKKLSKKNDEGLDALMEDAAKSITHEKVEEPVKSRKSKSYTLSKEERAKIKKLKKL